MKNIITNAAVVLIGLSFISCSNMTIGFEEDSPFYNGPIIDTREEKTVESKSVQKSEEVIAEEKTVKELKSENPTTQGKISTKQEEPISQETAVQEENETTFSYDPNDGD